MKNKKSSINQRFTSHLKRRCHNLKCGQRKAIAVLLLLVLAILIFFSFWQINYKQIALPEFTNNSIYQKKISYE